MQARPERFPHLGSPSWDCKLQCMYTLMGHLAHVPLAKGAPKPPKLPQLGPFPAELASKAFPGPCALDQP